MFCSCCHGNICTEPLLSCFAITVLLITIIFNQIPFFLGYLMERYTEGHSINQSKVYKSTAFRIYSITIGSGHYTSKKNLVQIQINKRNIIDWKIIIILVHVAFIVRAISAFSLCLSFRSFLFFFFFCERKCFIFIHLQQGLKIENCRYVILPLFGKKNN